ncbi:hypothetical protein K2173_015889 [Erythroxylum novogranatense]|uniref:Zinc knuckle CX2CX4HX4C domain-containing protein n=1 Tax=Erythroxylum novogranatense TaxID=1862640 RepID=A0AAV8SFD0_9ROSI|nr:hypothetical protein K2173_015889 [Erythroxylum novogranatense]
MTLQAHGGRYVRIAVEIDLSLPLCTSVTLDGETLPFSYEGLPQLCYSYGKVGHASALCPQRQCTSDPHRPASGDTHEDVTSHTTPADAGVPAGPFVETPTVGSGYGSWIQVQRRPRPSLQRLQQASSPPASRTLPARSSNTSPPTVSTRFAALVDGREDETAEAVHSHTHAPLANPFQGLGKPLAPPVPSGISQARGMGSPLPSHRPKQPSRRGPKGKKGPIKPQLRGESSGTKPILTPSPFVIPLVPLQPTSIDKNIAIIIPTHTEMLCDQRVLAASDEAVEERLQLMDGVEALGVVEPVSASLDPTKPAPPDPGVALPCSDLLPDPGAPEDQAMPPSAEPRDTPMGGIDST